MIVAFTPIEAQHGEPLFAWDMLTPPRIGETILFPRPDESGEHPEAKVVAVRYAEAPAQPGSLPTCHAVAVLERLFIPRPKASEPKSLF